MEGWEEPAFPPQVPILQLEERPWHSHLAFLHWPFVQLEKAAVGLEAAGGEVGCGRNKGKCVMEER